MTTGTGQPLLRWHGGASLLQDGTTKLGGLYVMDDAVWFIEAGRAREGRFGGAGALLMAAGLLGAVPLAIEAYSRALLSGARGWAALVGEIVGGTVAVGLALLSAVVAVRSRDRAEADLARLGGADDVPEPQVVERMCEVLAGSFRLPIGDVVRWERVGERDLRITDRLDNVWLARVVPDREGFLAAVIASCPDAAIG